MVSKLQSANFSDILASLRKPFQLYTQGGRYRDRFGFFYGCIIGVGGSKIIDTMTNSFGRNVHVFTNEEIVVRVILF